MMRHSIAVLLLAFAGASAAADVSLIGTFDTKAAILGIGGGAPKTVKVGQSFGGVTVISVEKDRATVEIDGARKVLLRGQTYSTNASSGHASVTLARDAGGHYIASGMVNGGSVRFVVDTGATMIALPASDAERLGIDYRSGQTTTTQTAAGPTSAYRVRLNSVRVGSIELSGIDGIVIESGLPIALLGMSFLNRVEMRNDAGGMTLTKRY